ncbi:MULTISPECIES: hypothetical protein [Chryseobacterium]|jgi:hypothetical protein|uniref:hypothetical protein n=1 Tax=Chryseobacterium TaxID=59732 RepID=UPI0004132C32|nr:MULTISPECIES: hypothetical protein [Chryseobacterium]MDQ0593425.1 putative RNase H-like nuclease (RuvC/YqgF family) [Chryseobacterium ginsenosidimutans]VFA44138.1 Uncharacterised protein [Chryseobacterium indologenes]VXB99525.1 conserved hypothetical protein [Chryseobacterium sp. 8AT]
MKLSKLQQSKEYEHTNKEFSELDKRLRRFWKDMYGKLLKSKQYEQSRRQNGV